ncbi:MAG: DUF2785 domain-containing protein [Oenococcus sp.]|uniref:DUF2785 domain-containing protein n=1 Tax=Oenococcus sp. TaxID=1979414 RepID=UPI0039E74FF3
MQSDQRERFLSHTERTYFFESALKFMEKERDYRGHTNDHGWAHAIAHGSDFLGAGLQDPLFPKSQIEEALQIIPLIISRVEKRFSDDEEQRIASAYVGGLAASNIKETDFIVFSKATNQQIWQQFNFESNISFYRLDTWLQIMQSLFFLLPNRFFILKSLLEKQIKDYYSQMGE